MPLCFLADSAESFTTEEVNQERFGYAISTFSEEMRRTSFDAPLIYGFSAVTREGYNFICGQYIRGVH